MRVVGGVLALALALFWLYLMVLWIRADVANPHWLGYVGQGVSAVAGVSALLALAAAGLTRAITNRVVLVWLGVSVFISALIWLMSSAILSSN